LRVGLNLLYLIPGVVGGTETYARGLLAGLAGLGDAHDYVVYVNREGLDWAVRLPARFTVRCCAIPGRRRGLRYAYEQGILPRRAAADRIDVLHSLGYVMPLVTSCRRVVTIHDLNFLAFGHTWPWTRRAPFEVFVRASVARADAIIAVSEFTRRELHRLLAVAPGRVAVTHEAAEPPSEVEIPDGWRPPGVDGPYFLVFSSPSPHKNVARLLSAFARVRQCGRVRHGLAVVGHLPPGMAVAQEGVRVLGYLGADDLERVFRCADGLLFPSTYEGFGLPVLEAMARAIPVACSTAGSLPEVAGEAALPFDPTDEIAMGEAIAQLADPATRTRLREAGRRRAAEFSWVETARQTVEVYERVARGRSGS
jgi:glycosyltransferase involved in cell wall biosynthesis